MRLAILGSIILGARIANSGLVKSYNELVFVWDEKKRLSNFEKHGLDFVYAFIVYDNQSKYTEQSTRSGEERYADIAYIAPFRACLTLVYTRRGDAVRIISFRKSSKRERRVCSQSSSKPH